MIRTEIEMELLRLLEFVSRDFSSDDSPAPIGTLDRQRTFKAISQLLWWLRREGLFKYAPSSGLRPFELPSNAAWAIDLRELVEKTSLGKWLEIEGNKMIPGQHLDAAACRHIGVFEAERYTPKLEC